ncbi:hypothetical protein, partial [Comamonas thiooxydans]
WCTWKRGRVTATRPASAGLVACFQLLLGGAHAAAFSVAFHKRYFRLINRNHHAHGVGVDFNWGTPDPGFSVLAKY